MELLNLRMVEELDRQFDVRLIGPSGASRHAPGRVRVVEAPLRPLPVFLGAAMWRACIAARRWRPDVIVAGSGLTAPVVWLAARLSGAITAVYLHGLDVGIRNSAYRLLWMPAIRRLDRIVANSRATADLAIGSSASAERIVIVHPGVDMPCGDHAEALSGAFRDELDWRHKRILLSVGRLTERKGLREFVRFVLPQIVDACADAVLAVIGDAPADSLFAKAQTRDSILEAATAAGVADHVHFMGVITDRNRLAAAYCAADVHVFPVRQIAGDPEGFGMVAVEAASFGLPTVAYATGGIVDAVDDGVSGYLVAPGDSRAFADKVLRLLREPLDRETIIGHAERFAWPRFGEKIRDALQPF